MNVEPLLCGHTVQLNALNGVPSFSSGILYIGSNGNHGCRSTVIEQHLAYRSMAGTAGRYLKVSAACAQCTCRTVGCKRSIANDISGTQVYYLILIVVINNKRVVVADKLAACKTNLC